MPFPVELDSTVNINGVDVRRRVVLHGGLTVLIGPNGSGKTHLMRGLKTPLQVQCPGKKVRFLSAGRMGLLEQYRSDYDGHRGDSPNYQNARYGSVDDTNRRHRYETLHGKVLNVSGFPITIQKDADVVKIVSEALGLSSA